VCINLFSIVERTVKGSVALISIPKRERGGGLEAGAVTGIETETGTGTATATE